MVQHWDLVQTMIEFLSMKNCRCMRPNHCASSASTSYTLLMRAVHGYIQWYYRERWQKMPSSQVKRSCCFILTISLPQLGSVCFSRFCDLALFCFVSFFTQAIIHLRQFHVCRKVHLKIQRISVYNLSQHIQLPVLHPVSV